MLFVDLLEIVCSCFKMKFGLFQSLKPAPHLFAQLSKVLKLSKVQEVIFGLALLNSSSSDLRGFGKFLFP